MWHNKARDVIPSHNTTHCKTAQHSGFSLGQLEYLCSCLHPRERHSFVCRCTPEKCWCTCYCGRKMHCLNRALKDKHMTVTLTARIHSSSLTVWQVSHFRHAIHLCSTQPCSLNILSFNATLQHMCLHDQIQKLNKSNMVKTTKVRNNLKEKLTVCKRSEEHPEAAETARLVGPHPHYSNTGVQHDVISYCTTKLCLQETTHHSLL